MWNAATVQQQPVNAAISSPMISPVAPPTVNMADLVAMPTNVSVQNLAQMQQRTVVHHSQVRVDLLNCYLYTLHYVRKKVAPYNVWQ